MSDKSDGRSSPNNIYLMGSPTKKVTAKVTKVQVLNQNYSSNITRLKTSFL